jgi:hypothetical protein
VVHDSRVVAGHRSIHSVVLAAVMDLASERLVDLPELLDLGREFRRCRPFVCQPLTQRSLEPDCAIGVSALRRSRSHRLRSNHSGSKWSDGARDSSYSLEAGVEGDAFASHKVLIVPYW